MVIKLTEHALKQMKIREINLKEIIKTLNNPEKITNDSYGNAVAQKLFGPQLLRIVFYQKDNEKIIITMYKTTRLKKYI